MRVSKLCVALAMAGALMIPRSARAQSDRYQSKVTVGVAFGVWDRVPVPETDHRSGTSIGPLMEFRIGERRAEAWRIRVLAAAGRGDDALQPGFNFGRWVVGAVRPVVSASSGVFNVYLAAAAGPVFTREQGRRITRISGSASIGFDAILGNTPASIAAEFELHSIGAHLFGTASLGVRIHF